MTATMTRVGFEVDAIDVFCGYGGSSQGIHAAGATVRAAANHSQLAIDCHAENFPDTEHWVADLVDPDAKHYVDPADLPVARFAWFSPSCTHHSPANAKKVYQRGLQASMLEDDDWDEQEYVNSERSRVTMSCVLRYVERNHPEIVVVENVIEVTKWGPDRDGSTFRWWMGELDKLGYNVEPLFLNSMFFPPCPQSRDRIYIVCWRKGNTKPDLDYRPTAYCMSDRCGGRLVDAVQTFKRPTAAWMGLPRWGKYLSQYDYRCPDCFRQVHPASWMALSAINWSNLGPTLGERDRMPAANTVERIRRAIRKFWYAPPVAMPDGVAMPTSVTTTHGDGDHDRGKHLAHPMSTLASHNGEAIALFVKNTNDAASNPPPQRGHHISEPLGAIVAEGAGQSLVSLLPIRSGRPRSNHAGDQLATVVGEGSHHAVIVAAAGHTSERDGQTRARHVGEQLFTQHTSDAFAVAAIPVLRGDHDQQVHPGEAFDTLSAAGTHHSLVTATFSKINGGPGDTQWHHPLDPLNTVTGRDTHGLVLLPWIDQWRSEPSLIHEQLATVTSHMRHSLASIEPFEGEITDDMLMGARFRMLEPDPELRRAMAFGDDYVILGNKTQQTAGLGNAVTPPFAAWITERCLATLR